MIYASARAAQLAGFRLVVYGLWLANVAADPFPQLAELPSDWFAPHGPWALLPRAAWGALWNAEALGGLKLSTLGCVALALLGVRPVRLWAVLAALSLTLVTAFVRGFGHADHAQLQLLFLTLLLPFLPAWDRLSLSREKPPTQDARYAAAFAACALVFALPYFATAAYRLAHEGGALFFGRSMLHFIARDTLALDHLDSTLGLVLLEDPLWLPLLNAGFAAVTAAELAAPFIHLRAAWAAAWLAVMAPFHVLSPLLMHTLFAENIVLMVALYAWPLGWGRSRAATA